MSFLSKLFHFVMLIIKKYNIDDSHGLSHSMDVLQYANKIYEEEVIDYPLLKQHENMIYISSILHDMCDKKYMDEITGLKEIEGFLKEESPLTNIELNVVKQIISTMSYSKVKVNGFPNLGAYQRAYHVVREADLLAAYDFDRCIIYKMNKNNGDFDEAFNNARELFDVRVFKHTEDSLFLCNYSRRESLQLHKCAVQRISFWKNISKSPMLL